MPSVSSGAPGVSGDWTVWLHTVGFGLASSNATLWTEVFSGRTRDLKVTVPPGVICTELSVCALPCSWKKLSPVSIVASTSALPALGADAASPHASAGTPAAAPTAHTIHGKTVFLIPTPTPAPTWTSSRPKRMSTRRTSQRLLRTCATKHESCQLKYKPSAAAVS
jgi:hypothetical protein